MLTVNWPVCLLFVTSEVHKHIHQEKVSICDYVWYILPSKVLQYYQLTFIIKIHQKVRSRNAIHYEKRNFDILHVELRIIVDYTITCLIPPSSSTHSHLDGMIHSLPSKTVLFLHSQHGALFISYLASLQTFSRYSLHGAGSSSKSHANRVKNQVSRDVY